MPQLDENTKALYEIANSIDRLTLVLGRKVVIDFAQNFYDDEEDNESELFGDFLDSRLCDALTDAENAIYDRSKKGIDLRSRINMAIRRECGIENLRGTGAKEARGGSNVTWNQMTRESLRRRSKNWLTKSRRKRNDLYCLAQAAPSTKTRRLVLNLRYSQRFARYDARHLRSRRSARRRVVHF